MEKDPDKSIEQTVTPISDDEKLSISERKTSVSVDQNSDERTGSSSQDGGSNAWTDNPFLDPNTAAHWTGVYEKSQYECRHRFDPHFTWSKEEEKRLIRKVDIRVCAWACCMFFSLQVSRESLSQALSDNLLDDLGINTDDYNVTRMLTLLAFMFAELPSQLVSKTVGPDRWIPTLITSWSIVSMCQAGVTGRAGLFTTRCLMGALQGGFTPDTVLWMSYFYTSRELPTRLTVFYMTLSITSIVTALMAFGLLHMRGVAGWAGWQWLFLIEGLITVCIGAAAFFLMPPSIVQTKTWYRPQGWFTDREEKILVNRVLRDDPSKGDMNNRQPVTLKQLWSAAKDYDLWPLYAIGILSTIPTSPPSQYMTLTLRALGFDPFTTNLLTIPQDVVHIITLVLLVRLSERLNQRALVAMLGPLWCFPCILALRFWPGVNVDSWGTYALVATLLSYPSFPGILFGWVSKNSNNVGARTVSITFYSMGIQLGAIGGTYIYREDDRPIYRRGNTWLIVVNLLIISLFLFSKVWYVMKNKQRDKIWNAMSAEEQKEYEARTDLKGSRRLDFRFAH